MKRMESLRNCAIFGAVALCLSVPGLASENRGGNYGYYPGLSISLGKGFNPHSPMRDHQKCFTGLTRELINGGASDRTVVDMNVVRSERGLRAVLGIDQKINAGFLGITAETDVGFSNTMEVNSDAVHVVIRGSTDYSGETLDFGQASYLPEIRKLLEEGNHQAVIDRCGSELVSTIRRGAKVAVILTIQGMTATDTQKSDLKVSGGGEVGPVSGKASAAINAMLSATNSQLRISLRAIIHGGTGVRSTADLLGALLSSPKSLENLGKGVVTLMHDLESENGAITGFSTIAMPGVDAGLQSLITEAKTDRLTELVSLYRHRKKLDQRMRSLYFALDHRGEKPPEFEVLPDSLIEEGREELPFLDLYLRQIAAAHQRCLRDDSEDLSACVLPQAPVLGSLELMDVIFRNFLQ